MAYDPRQMLAIGRMGLGMMGPQPSPFDRNTPGRPPQWWEQPLPPLATASSSRARRRPGLPGLFCGSVCSALEFWGRRFSRPI